MKLMRNTLIVLYINLLMIISFTVYGLMRLMYTNLEGWVSWLLLIGAVLSEILSFLFAAKNLINALKLYRHGEYNSLRRHMRNLKFGLIPYFIINFLFYTLLFLLFIVSTRGILLISPFPLLFLIPTFFTYLTVILTSFYGIGVIVLLWKKNELRTRSFILHLLMQVCFVLDVIDTIILILKHKEESPKQTLNE